MIIILLSCGCAGAFGVYELLVKRFAPSRLEETSRHEGSSSRSRLKGRRASSGGKERVGASSARKRPVSIARKRPVPAALVSAADRIERLLPMARSDGEAYRALLQRAGWSIEPETWRGARILSAVACGLLAGFAMARMGMDPLRTSACTVGAAAVGWMVPRAVLTRAIAKRRRTIESQLPDAMELLGIAVAAGCPVEQCFREVAENVGRPLAGELETVDREVNLLGHSRDKALDHLAERCASRDVSAFVTQLTLAVNQGASIAESLSAQAALARRTAQTATLERIRKMPVKLDIVLSFCFLPPTIALVVVPTVVDLLGFLNDTLQ